MARSLRSLAGVLYGGGGGYRDFKSEKTLL